VRAEALWRSIVGRDIRDGRPSETPADGLFAVQLDQRQFGGLHEAQRGAI
jgi:hypothetical protein